VQHGRRRWQAIGGRTRARARLGLLAAAATGLAAAWGGTASGAQAPDGKAVFQANCAGCHTLAAAGATGTVGPNLDSLKPALARVRAKVPVGGSVMPAFAGRLSSGQIEAVARFVSSSVGGQPSGGQGGTSRVVLVVRRHKPTGLAIRVPSPYAMGFSKGIYVLRAKGRVLTYSRVVTAAGADAYVAALTGQIGGNVVFRAGGPAESAVQVEFPNRKEAMVVRRAGTTLVVTTSTSLVGFPLGLDSLRAIGVSAKGGVTLRPPAAKTAAVKPIELVPFRTSDGGATAQVPAGWTVDGGQGNVYGSSDDGAFALGLSFNIVLPNTAPGPLPQSIVVAPFMNATTALQNVVPQIFKIGNVQIRSLLRDAALPGFTSSGLFQFDYTSNGRPWTGIALIATDSPDKYGNISWNLYYSAIGVRVGSSPSVGLGLLETWRSWNPSGAIAGRTRAQIQILNETAQTWQQVSEFRSVTADRQARDVGCLLQGYYVIEDNSRKYDLPPLPCGQIYSKRDP
jgi:cytochrome c6